MDKKTKEYNVLLNNLRILSCTVRGEYLGTTNNHDFYCRYSSNWWNTLTNIVRLETWNSTYSTLMKMYCEQLPFHISQLDKDIECSKRSQRESDSSNVLSEEKEKNPRRSGSNLTSNSGSDLLKAKDLYQYCRKGLVGLKNLKDTYNIAYQTSSGGIYDNEFDTLIQSYADIQITQLGRITDNNNL